MANSSGVTPSALDAMMKMASAKLGVSAEQLRQTLNDPAKASELLGRFGVQSSAADNRQQIEQLLRQNPKARTMLDELLGGKK